MVRPLNRFPGVEGGELLAEELAGALKAGVRTVPSGMERMVAISQGVENFKG